MAYVFPFNAFSYSLGYQLVFLISSRISYSLTDLDLTDIRKDIIYFFDIPENIMVYVVQYLAKALKGAREGKKLSQRGLSSITGMPQAQISKIENAAVDMKASTLIELARTLDLEVMLVPRKHLPAVKGLINSASKTSSKTLSPRPAYALDKEGEDG